MVMVRSVVWSQAAWESSSAPSSSWVSVGRSLNFPKTQFPLLHPGDAHSPSLTASSELSNKMQGSAWKENSPQASLSDREHLEQRALHKSAVHVICAKAPAQCRAEVAGRGSWPPGLSPAQPVGNPWAGYATALCLGFLICKEAVFTVHTSQDREDCYLPNTENSTWPRGSTLVSWLSEETP